jgi:hypothetical protein
MHLAVALLDEEVEEFAADFRACEHAGLNSKRLLRRAEVRGQIAEVKAHDHAVRRKSSYYRGHGGTQREPALLGCLGYQVMKSSGVLFLDSRTIFRRRCWYGL